MFPNHLPLIDNPELNIIFILYNILHEQPEADWAKPKILPVLNRKPHCISCSDGQMAVMTFPWTVSSVSSVCHKGFVTRRTGRHMQQSHRPVWTPEEPKTGSASPVSLWPRNFLSASALLCNHFFSFLIRRLLAATAQWQKTLTDLRPACRSHGFLPKETPEGPLRKKMLRRRPSNASEKEQGQKKKVSFWQETCLFWKVWSGRAGIAPPRM